MPKFPGSHCVETLVKQVTCVHYLTYFGLTVENKFQSKHGKPKLTDAMFQRLLKWGLLECYCQELVNSRVFVIDNKTRDSPHNDESGIHNRGTSEHVILSSHYIRLGMTACRAREWAVD
ncbi:hypothetical protein J6590_038220 [Homalodisca vitripennis]|nr:hypothetical protein J6590_038220 [Homalodisca vitripennis]